jgi:hypothetical protein
MLLLQTNQQRVYYNRHLTGQQLRLKAVRCVLSFFRELLLLAAAASTHTQKPRRVVAVEGQHSSGMLQ